MTYMYIFVRKDLSKEQQAIQSVHAAIESTKKWPYLGYHPRLVLIGVKNEEKLKKILDNAREHGIIMAEFFEDDVGMTAIASRPIISEEDRNVFKKYQLLKLE